MTLIDVSFGIFALMPLGWLFMAFVIIIECVIMTRIILPKWFSAKIYRVTTWTNMISGIIGFGTTLILNGGWFSVIWFPWVSNNEINLTKPEALKFLIIFYTIAFVLTLVIEILSNILFLYKEYPQQKIIKATMIANIVSYAAGTIVLYSYSFR